MRRRILWVAVTAVVLAVAVLGVPLAFAVGRLAANDERAELQQVALRAAVAVSPTYLGGDPIELPSSEAGISLAVYDANGHRVSGLGPLSLDKGARGALQGGVVGASTGGQLVEVAAVTHGERVIAVVRSASPESAVRLTTIRWWLALLGACVVAALAAAAFAAWQSRRLAAPLVELAHAAVGLGAGDFSVRTTRSGVAEIDDAGASLRRTAERLATLIERERSFATHASHQLRTPLTQLQLELESGLQQGDAGLRQAAGSAMETADQLSRTIDDVLALARPAARGVGFDLETLLDQCREQWHGPLASQGRPIRVEIESRTRVAASLPAARQILRVLLDNALRHGSGAVLLRARDSHGAVAIDVVDEGESGPVVPGDDRLGLAMARSLAVAEGGRLLVDQAGPGTRFTVLLPAESRPSSSAD